MKRDISERSKRTSRAFLVGSAFNMLGLIIFWLGITATTCTMCDTDSLIASVIYATPVYVVSFVLWIKYAPSVLSLTLTSLLLPAHLLQAWFAIRISYVALALNGCVCGAYKDYPVGEISSLGWPEYVSGPILLCTSVTSLALVTMKAWKISETRKRENFDAS